MRGGTYDHRDGVGSVLVAIEAEGARGGANEVQVGEVRDDALLERRGRVLAQIARAHPVGVRDDALLVDIVELCDLYRYRAFGTLL